MKITDLENYSVVSKGRSPMQTKTEQVPTKPADTDGFLLDVGQGLLKSAGDIGLGIGSLGRKIQGGVSKAVGAVTGIENFGMGTPSIFDAGSSANVKAKELLARDTTGEKVGGFIGDVASFALPGGAVTKATKGAGLLTRAGALGASDAVMTTVRSGQFDRDTVDSAIIGAAFPIGGAGISAAKKAVLPSGVDAGGKVINSLIKPLLKDFSYGKNPGNAVAQAGITANSLDELAQKITVVRQQAGDEIAQKVAQNTNKFDATTALNSLDEALDTAFKAPKTNAPIIARIQNLKDDLLKVNENGIPTRKLTDLSAEELWQFNKDIGELTRWTGNASDDEIVNKALTNSYRQTRSLLEGGVDGISDLSEKYANLKSAEIATIYRDKIAARQNLISFTGTNTGIATGLITAAASGGVTVPLLVGATAAGLTEASKSPAFKTRLAAWLATATPAEKKAAFTEAPWLRGTLQTVLLDETE